MPSPRPSRPLLLEPSQLDSRTGSKSSPRPTLPSWLAPSGTGSFAWSLASDPLISSSRPDSPHLPTLHPTQAQIRSEASRFNVLALGRRSGKTTLAEYLLAEAALAGKPVAYCSPTYKLLADTWRQMRVMLAPATRAKSETEHRLELGSGGTLEMWSLDDPDPARGRKYARVVLDEAAMVRSLMDVWQLALRPTLADLQGDAWFLSTPQGLNDFYSLFKLGQDPLEDEWRAWQMPTSVNPYIPPDELAAARKELPERAYAQEFEARFLTLEGAGVFRGVHAVARLEPTPPQRGHQYVMGVDWGRTDDFTVVSVIDASTQRQVLVDRFSQIEYELQTERLHKIASVYKPQQILAESNSMGLPIIERLQRGYRTVLGDSRPPLPVVPFTTTNATKAAAIIDLSVAIENGMLTLLDDAVQTAELLSFESTVLPSGLLRYGAPLGQHDDTVMALALAYQAGKVEPVMTRSSYGFNR